MTYRIEFAKPAAKQFRSLPTNIQRQMQPAIDALSSKPRPSGVKKLKGSDLYRIRSGDYRIIYQIQDAELIIIVIKVGHRGKVYQ